VPCVPREARQGDWEINPDEINGSLSINRLVETRVPVSEAPLDPRHRPREGVP
jgi:hypothetical protein